MNKPESWLQTDVDKALLKSKYYKIGTTSRLFASEKMSRYHNLLKLLKALNVKDVIYKLVNFVSYYSKVLNKDLSVDDNVCVLVLLLKYCKDVELSDLASAFGRFYLINEYENEYRKERFDKWMFTKREHTIDGDEELFYKEFEKSADRILSKFDVGKINNKFITLEEFIKEVGLWGTSGSMFGMELPKDFKDKIKKNKWGLAFSVEGVKMVNEVLDAIKYKKNVYYKSMQKNESTNVRYVVVADMVTYFIEAYISYFIEDSIGAIPSLYSFKSNRYKLNWFEKRKLKLLLKKHILDIDYSGWDENITLRMLAIVILKLKLKTQRSFLDNMFDFLIHAVYNSYLDGEKIENGLGSGRRWTTLLNSLINAIISDMAIRMSNNQMDDLDAVGTESIDLGVVGDDMDGVFESIDAIMRYIKALDSMNFSINKLKSKVDLPEFLKINYGLLGVSESPFRMLRSVLYSTEDERDQSKSEQVNSRLDNWAKILGRLNSYFRLQGEAIPEPVGLTELIIGDIWHVLDKKYSRKYIYRFLQSPSTVGGGGLGLKTINEYERGKKYWVSVNINNGVFSLDKLIGHKIDRVMKNSVISKFVNHRILQGMIIKNKKYVIKAGANLEIIKPKYNYHYMLMLMMERKYTIIENSSKYFINSALPQPDGSGLYTSAILNRGMVDVKKVLDDYKNEEFIEDSSGNKFTKNGLYEYSYVAWLNMIKRKYSLKMLQLILDDGDKIVSMPRELVSAKGETAGMLAWLVLKSLILTTFNGMRNTEKLISFQMTLGAWLKSENYQKWLYNDNILNVICVEFRENQIRLGQMKMGFYVSSILV